MIMKHKGNKNPLNNAFDQDYLKSILHYNPKTGIFKWLIKPSVNTDIGDIAGCVDKSRGYINIKIKYIRYKAHRLAWLYMTGEWPEVDVDHKDTNQKNNKWKNLRLATINQNQRNKKLQRNNTSGYKGVTESPNGKWIAQIVVNTKHIYLGRYDKPEEAHKVYCVAAKKYHKQFARTE